ncbi:U3 small nucleolar ribonucleoprotein mpp10 [Sesbania bispinosa]|nr:U3 small nucleolar ribonucleoprotein mpp10 [Sesbania bispinosa]
MIWTPGFSLLEVWEEPQRALSAWTMKVLLLYPTRTYGEELSEDEEEGGDPRVGLPGRSSSLESATHRDRRE